MLLSIACSFWGPFQHTFCIMDIPGAANGEQQQLPIAARRRRRLQLHAAQQWPLLRLSMHQYSSTPKPSILIKARLLLYTPTPSIPPQGTVRTGSWEQEQLIKPFLEAAEEGAPPHVDHLSPRHIFSHNQHHHRKYTSDKFRSAGQKS